MRPVRLSLFLVLVTLLSACAIDRPASVRHTLVVRAKSWVGPVLGRRGYAAVFDHEFGFGDSLVLELEVGPSIGAQRVRLASERWLTDLDGLSLGSTAADGRVWLRLHGVLLDVLNERGVRWTDERPDSILMGPDPVSLGTHSADGGQIYALRVRRDAARAKASRRLVSLHGVVRSRWTGERLQTPHGFRQDTYGPWTLVTVAYGDTFTWADSTGAFELRGVPEGRVRINATCRTFQQFGTVVVDAPDDSVIVLVDDDEKGFGFSSAPPAQAIEVLLPGQRRRLPADPRTVPGRLEWLSGAWEGELNVLPSTPTAASQSIPVRCEFTSPTPGGDVRLVMRDASSPTGKVLAEHLIRKRPGPWGPLRDLYDAVGTQWRYRAVGDSLLGLELDSPGGAPVRRLHVRRLSGPERVR